jgi:hypothetical protein
MSQPADSQKRRAAIEPRWKKLPAPLSDRRKRRVRPRAHSRRREAPLEIADIAR